MMTKFNGSNEYITKTSNWSLLIGPKLTNIDTDIKGHELPHYLAVGESKGIHLTYFWN